MPMSRFNYSADFDIPPFTLRAPSSFTIRENGRNELRRRFARRVSCEHTTENDNETLGSLYVIQSIACRELLWPESLIFRR